MEFERAVRNVAECDAARAAHWLTELEAILNAPPAPYDAALDRARTKRYGRAVWAHDLHSDGLNAQAIADRIGVSRSSVRRYLKGLLR